MRINSHTHIFNLKSVFTRKTIDILIRRISSIDLPVLIKEKVTDLLGKTVSESITEAETAQLVEAFIRDVQSDLFSHSDKNNQGQTTVLLVADVKLWFSRKPAKMLQWFRLNKSHNGALRT